MGETDLISRQAVIDAIDSFILDEVTDVYGDTVREILERLPTIEERKTAKWIKGRCSNCGAHAPFWPMASTYYESDYCPNCGCSMMEEE